LVGSGLSFIIRFGLSQPGGIITSKIFKMVITAHGLIMIFFFVMPILIGGFGNWLIPLMLGCMDMSFARLKNLRF